MLTDVVLLYWWIRCDSSSPYIHPIGWCEQQGRPLTAPRGTCSIYTRSIYSVALSLLLFWLIVPLISRSPQPRELCVGGVPAGNWFHCCSQFILCTGEWERRWRRKVEGDRAEGGGGRGEKTLTEAQRAICGDLCVCVSVQSESSTRFPGEPQAGGC